MFIIDHKPKIKYIKLYENEDWEFGEGSFEKYNPIVRSFCQFDVYFTVFLSNCEQSQTYWLPVVTESRLTNLLAQLCQNRYLLIKSYECWDDIKNYIEGIINSRMYGGFEDMRNQLQYFFSEVTE